MAALEAAQDKAKDAIVGITEGQTSSLAQLHSRDEFLNYQDIFLTVRTSPT